MEQRRIFLIVDNTADALELVKNVKDVNHVNLGNMKLTSERTMITPSLAVSEKEKEQIHEMVAEGAEVECRAVPTDKKVMAESLI